MSPHRIEGGRPPGRRGDERNRPRNGLLENSGEQPNNPREQPQRPFEPQRLHQQRRDISLNGEPGPVNGEASRNGHPFDVTFLNGDTSRNGYPFDATFSHDTQQDVSSGDVAQEQLTQRRFLSDDGTLSHILYYRQVQGQEHPVLRWNFDNNGRVERIMVFNNQRPGPPAAHDWTFQPGQEFPNIQIHDNTPTTLYDQRSYNDGRVYQLQQLVFNENFGDLMQYYPDIFARERYEDNRDQITAQLHTQIRLAESRQHEQGIFEDLIREHPIFEHLSEYSVYQVDDERSFRITSRDRFGRVLHSHTFRYNGDEVDSRDIF